MSAISFCLMWKGVTNKSDYKQGRSYVMVYHIRTNDKTDNGIIAAQILPIQRGMPYPDDPGALALDIDMQQMENSPFEWKAVITFKSEFKDFKNSLDRNSNQQQNPTDIPQDPVLRHAIESWSYRKVQKAMQYDFSTPVQGGTNASGYGYGKAVVNNPLTRQPFLPPIEREISYPCLTIKKNYRNFSYDNFRKYQQTINKDVWYDFNPRVVLIDDISMEQRFENGFGFWEVTWRFLINGDKWNPTKYLSQGYYELLPAAGGSKLFPIRDPLTGLPVTSPWRLSADGKALKPDQDDYFVEYYWYEELNFTGIIP